MTTISFLQESVLLQKLTVTEYGNIFDAKFMEYLLLFGKSRKYYLFKQGTPIMNAIILAAGKGSRMRKDGYSTPKPLLPILGVPNLERTVWIIADYPRTTDN